MPSKPSTNEDRLKHALTYMHGANVEVNLKNGTKHQGVLSSVSTIDNYSIVLSSAKEIPNDSDNKAEKIVKPVIPKLIISGNEIETCITLDPCPNNGKRATNSKDENSNLTNHKNMADDKNGVVAEGGDKSSSSSAAANENQSSVDGPKVVGKLDADNLAKLPEQRANNQRSAELPQIPAHRSMKDSSVSKDDRQKRKDELINGTAPRQVVSEMKAINALNLEPAAKGSSNRKIMPGLHQHKFDGRKDVRNIDWARGNMIDNKNPRAVLGRGNPRGVMHGHPDRGGGGPIDWKAEQEKVKKKREAEGKKNGEFKPESRTDGKDGDNNDSNNKDSKENANGDSKDMRPKKGKDDPTFASFEIPAKKEFQKLSNWIKDFTVTAKKVDDPPGNNGKAVKPKWDDTISKKNSSPETSVSYKLVLGEATKAGLEKTQECENLLVSPPGYMMPGVTPSDVLASRLKAIENPNNPQLANQLIQQHQMAAAMNAQNANIMGGQANAQNIQMNGMNQIAMGQQNNIGQMGQQNNQFAVAPNMQNQVGQNLQNQQNALVPQNQMQNGVNNLTGIQQVNGLNVGQQQVNGMGQQQPVNGMDQNQMQQQILQVLTAAGISPQNLQALPQDQLQTLLTQAQQQVMQNQQSGMQNQGQQMLQNNMLGQNQLGQNNMGQNMMQNQNQNLMQNNMQNNIQNQNSQMQNLNMGMMNMNMNQGQPVGSDQNLQNQQMQQNQFNQNNINQQNSMMNGINQQNSMVSNQPTSQPGTMNNLGNLQPIPPQNLQQGGNIQQANSFMGNNMQQNQFGQQNQMQQDAN